MLIGNRLDQPELERGFASCLHAAAAGCEECGDCEDYNCEDCEEPAHDNEHEHEHEHGHDHGHDHDDSASAQPQAQPPGKGLVGGDLRRRVGPVSDEST